MIAAPRMLTQAARIATSGMTFALFAGPSHADPIQIVGQIPEPATILLLGVGLALLWWGIKRKP